MAAKKNLKARKIGNGLLWEVFFEGGGSIPKELSGTFGSEHLANHAIEIFKAKVQDKLSATRNRAKASK